MLCIISVSLVCLDYFAKGRVQYERYNFFPSVEFFSYFINVLNHFLRLLHRTSRDRNVYWPPLK